MHSIHQKNKVIKVWEFLKHSVNVNITKFMNKFIFSVMHEGIFVICLNSELLEKLLLHLIHISFSTFL